MTIPAGFSASSLDAACAAHFLSASGGVCIHVSTSGWGKCTDSRHYVVSRHYYDVKTGIVFLGLMLVISNCECFYCWSSGWFLLSQFSFVDIIFDRLNQTFSRARYSTLYLKAYIWRIGYMNTCMIQKVLGLMIGWVSTESWHAIG